MAMGRRKDRQGDLLVSRSEMPRSPGHVLYHRLQSVPIKSGFDGLAETPTAEDLMRQRIGAGIPGGGRGGRIWRRFRAAHAHRGHGGGPAGLGKRPDGFRRRIPHPAHISHLGVRAGKEPLNQRAVMIDRATENQGRQI